AGIQHGPVRGGDDRADGVSPGKALGRSGGGPWASDLTASPPERRGASPVAGGVERHGCGGWRDGVRAGAFRGAGGADARGGGGGVWRRGGELPGAGPASEPVGE